MFKAAMQRLGLHKARVVPVLDPTMDDFHRVMALAFATAKHDHQKSFDYPPEVTEAMARLEHQRNAVAHACVDRILQSTWRTPPTIQDQEREEGSVLEDAMRKHFKRIGLWRSFEEADKMSLVGTWSGLILQFADDSRLSEPLPPMGGFGGVEALEKAVPVWRSQLRPEADEKGYIYKWQYRASGDHTDIHPSRFLLVSENGRLDASGLLTRLYNSVRMAEKVAGSAAEDAWNAARTLLYFKMNADALPQELNKDEIGNAEGGTFADRVEFMMKAVNAGLMSTISAPAIEDAKLINSPMSDPSGSFDTIAKCLAAGSGVPLRSLFGSEEGRLAADQDSKGFLDRMEGRRQRVINPIIDELISRLIGIGAIPDDGREYGPIWEPLSEEMTQERAQMGNLLSDMNTKNVMNGGGILFDDNELRKAAGHRELNEREIAERQGAGRRAFDMANPPVDRNETNGG